MTGITLMEMAAVPLARLNLTSHVLAALHPQKMHALIFRDQLFRSLKYLMTTNTLPYYSMRKFRLNINHSLQKT